MNIVLKESNSYTITGIKVDFVCNKCYRTWAVYLDKNLCIPEGGDICKVCGRKLNNHKENVDNGHERTSK